jgi:hypothetical protein
MRRILPLMAIAIAITLVGCGGGSSPQNAVSANGAWSETLTDSSGNQLGSFTFNLTQSNSALTTSNLNLGNMGSLAACFGSGTIMTGQMGSGMMNGNTMMMTMSWTDSTGTDSITMQGNMGMGMRSSSGTFILTGQTTGCMSQMGTFTMTHS